MQYVPEERQESFRAMVAAMARNAISEFPGKYHTEALAILISDRLREGAIAHLVDRPMLRLELMHIPEQFRKSFLDMVDEVTVVTIRCFDTNTPDECVVLTGERIRRDTFRAVQDHLVEQFGSGTYRAEKGFKLHLTEPA